MDATTPETPRRGTLNLRIKPEDKNLIDRAARVHGKDRTAFVLDAARAAAEQVLLEQTLILASPESFAAFVDRLDTPPQATERLRATMRAPAPWE